MIRLTWLVGPPGAGKSTYARSLPDSPRILELTAMMSPLLEPLQLRKGVLSANGCLIKAIRHVELQEDHAKNPPLLVVAGLVPEDSLFPLSYSEEVLLLLPERARWERQLDARPSRVGSTTHYDDHEYSRQWYVRFEDWIARGLPMRRIEVPFDESLIGQSAGS